MTPNEIIREGRELLASELPPPDWKWTKATVILPAALDALEEATRRAEIAEAYAGDVQRYREMVIAAEARAERAEAALAKANEQCDRMHRIATDEAEARVRAEADRDEARRMYCHLSAIGNGGLPGNAKARIECGYHWPHEVDRLFPEEVKRG